MKHFYIAIVILFSMILFACESGGGEGDDPVSAPTTPGIKTFSGKIEKGAFQKGASIQASELDINLIQTGKVYRTNTIDNTGAYIIEGNDLQGILDLYAIGYYFNENTNVVESSTLELSGLVDSNESGGNINIVTHIIKLRVINLIKNQSKSFTEANLQAVNELYSTLNWTPENPLNTDVSQNANLLFLSSAICKNRTVSEVSDLLTTLANALADGSIDISVLDSSFQAVDCDTVEANMAAKYGSTPDIDVVKSQVLAYRNLEDTTVRIITVQPVESAEFYIINGSSLKGFVNNSIQNINIEYIQTYGGTTQTLNSTINDFFSITEGGIKTLYFSITVPEDKTYLFSQTSGILTEIETLPEKPSISNFDPFENTYYRLSWNNDAHTTQLLYSIIGGQNTGSGFLQRYIETTDYIKDGVNLGNGVFSQWSQGSNNIRWLSRDSYLIYDVAFGTIW